MYRVIVAGGIASGKSTFARELERLGALRIDLDELSRVVLDQDQALVAAIARRFGGDVVDADGRIVRRMLAQRAFASAADTAALEALELPAIERELRARLTAAEAGGGTDMAACCAMLPPCVVVEVPLLDRMDVDSFEIDEVVVVLAPLEDRVRRAVARGMDEDDARARMKGQPTDAWLTAHADLVVDNTGSEDDLLLAARSWWDEHERHAWTTELSRGPRGFDAPSVAPGPEEG